MSNETKFRKSLELWLQRNGLDQDSRFYTAEEWRGRGEELLCDAQLILVTAEGLNFLLNYNFSHPKVEEFRDLCKSFGYWFDLGHTWSIGFYPMEQTDIQRINGSYSQKLKDARWKEKSTIVKQRARNKCEDCGSATLPLHAHHCWYSYGLEPWEYPLDAFRCLCSNCHSTRHNIEHHLRAAMARYTQSELTILRGAIDNLFYWFDRDAALSFLKAVGHNPDNLADASANLAKFKTEPGSNT